MELPDASVPNDPTDGGAEPSPGEGGLEMPKLNQDAAAGEVKIQFASWQDVEALAKSTGKVTVVDVWSTSCLPCIKELPGLVELHKSLGDQVQCITMDVDYDGRKSKPAQTYEADVMEILKSVDATFTNFISTTASDDVYAAAELDSIPAVLVFDAKGNLFKKFVDAGPDLGFSYHDDVIPTVKQLLN